MRLLPCILYPLGWVALVSLAGTASAAQATFFRAINLNGPSLTIDGHTWDGKDARDFAATGKSFENQKVPLQPPTDAARTQMIRSSVGATKSTPPFQRAPGDVSGLPLRLGGQPQRALQPPRE